MGSFFIKKISDLRVSLDATENSCSTINRYSSQCFVSFTAFHRVDMDYIRKLVLRAPTKSCVLDPVPTNIMKDCLDELLPLLLTMINLSLESGFFPDIWKDSAVTPLLKNQGLDLVFKNFRPISNLSFVSKRDGALRTVPTNTDWKYSCVVYDYARKADLSNDY